MAPGGPDRSRDDASPRVARPSLARRATHRAAGPFDSLRVRGLLAAVGVVVVAATAFLVIHASSQPTHAAAGTTANSPSPESNGVAGGRISASVSPTDRPSPTSSVTPSATKSATLPLHAGQPAQSSRKGVAAWSFDGVDKALSESGARWYYTWSSAHSGISTPHGVEFVPMIWGNGSVTAGALAQAKSAGHYLLGFNEPDLSGQANMSVSQALGLWPKLQATGLRLGSPAVATGGATPGGWLDQFMSGAKARGYRVDFIALHWYGGDFVTANAVNQLKSYLQAVYDRYHKPIWLTEFALINFSGGTHYPSPSAQAAFLTASTEMLDGLSFVSRYAWFALPAADDGPSTGLFTSGPAVTAVGRAFEAAH